MRPLCFYFVFPLFSYAGSVSVLLGNGDGTFRAARDLATGSGPTSVAVANFRGAGHPLDLVVTNSASNSVSVLLRRKGDILH
jgi:hypothetical protein